VPESLHGRRPAWRTLGGIDTRPGRADVEQLWCQFGKRGQLVVDMDHGDGDTAGVGQPHNAACDRLVQRLDARAGGLRQPLQILFFGGLEGGPDELGVGALADHHGRRAGL